MIRKPTGRTERLCPETILNSTKGHGTVITGVIRRPPQPWTLNFFRGLTRIKKARPTRIGAFFYWGDEVRQSEDLFKLAEPFTRPQHCCGQDGVLWDPTGDLAEKYAGYFAHSSSTV